MAGDRGGQSASEWSASGAAYAPVIDDPQPGLGPLAGICAALAAVATRYVVFLPVDLPLLPSPLIAYMLHRAEITGRAVTIPSVNGFGQTFPVVLDRSVLPALQRDFLFRTRWLLFRIPGCGARHGPAHRERCC